MARIRVILHNSLRRRFSNRPAVRVSLCVRTMQAKPEGIGWRTVTPTKDKNLGHCPRCISFLFGGRVPTGGFMFCTIMCILFVFITWVARASGTSAPWVLYPSRHTIVSYYVVIIILYLCMFGCDK